MPLPPGFVKIDPEQTNGLPPGFHTMGPTAIKAAENHRRLVASAPAAGAGAFKRFLKGYGVPTSGTEFRSMIENASPAASMFNNPTLENALNVAAPGIGVANQVIDNVANENYAGLLGQGAALATQLSPFAVRGPKAPPAGRPSVKPLIEVTQLDPPAPGMGSRVGKAAYELLPVPRVIRAGKALLGKETPDRPPTKTWEELDILPDAPVSARPPVQGPVYSGTDFPFSQAVPEGPVPQGLGSAPLQSPAIVAQLSRPPLPELWQGPVPQSAAPAVVGNSPRSQPFLNPPSTAKKMSSDPGRLFDRFEPGDQGTRVTQDLTPGMNPQELQGAQSQTGQIQQTVDLGTQMNNPDIMAPPMPAVGFSPQMMQYLQTILSKGLPEAMGADPPGVGLGKNTSLQSHRTSQLAKIEAEKMGWDRDALLRGPSKKGKKK